MPHRSLQQMQTLSLLSEGLQAWFLNGEENSPAIRILLAYGMIIIKELGELSLSGGFYSRGHYAEFYFEKTRDIA